MMLTIGSSRLEEAHPHSPRVSVVIPTYNRAELLAAALDSVLAQTLQCFEIIVVDDGSTDQTEDLLRGYAKDLRYVRIEHCGLLGRVRNAGLKIARGDYVAFLDSDDLWTPEKLAYQLDVLEREPNVGIVCSNAQVLRCGESGPSGLYLGLDQGRSGRVLEELLVDNFIIASSAIVRRSVLNRTGFFTEERLLRGIEDYDLWLRVASISEVHYLADPLVIYREHPGSMRREVLPSAHWEGMLLILKRLRLYLRNTENLDDMTLALIRQQLWKHRVCLLRASLASRRYWDALLCVVRMMRDEPRLFARLPYTTFKSDGDQRS